MLTGCNEMHPQVVPDVSGTYVDDFGIQSVARNRPGCSLHQGVALLKDTPAGTAPVRRTGIRLCKPPR